MSFDHHATSAAIDREAASEPLEPRKSTRNCRHCAAALVPGETWYPSDQSGGRYRCIVCTKRINKETRRTTRLNGPRIDRSPAGIKARHKRSLFNYKRRSANHVCIEFTLNFEDVRWPAKCPYLGTPLDYTGRKPRTRANQYSIPSFDRIDPTKGYIPGNVQVISYKANSLKRDRPVAELLALARAATPETTAGREDLRTFYASVIRRHG